MHKGKTGPPVTFLEKLGKSVADFANLYTNLVEEDSILRDKFLIQSAMDIKRELSTLMAAIDKFSQEQLIQAAKTSSYKWRG